MGADTLTMFDIERQLEAQGVDVRKDYWSEHDKNRRVFVVPPAGKVVLVHSIEVRGDDIYVITTDG